ncbi:MAG TPA: class I SAM-dependent methyltransferase [Kofleriaceae bacterium]|jgi:SAM-dependent methyltransferase
MSSAVLSPADPAYFSRREPTTAPDYDAAYWGTVVDPDGKQRDRTRERDQHLEDLAIELAYIRALAPGRIVDVGCGLGFLLSGIPETWDRHGVEVSRFAAEHARTYGTIHVGDLSSAKFDDAAFDVVVLHHVIEHVDKPLALLREIRRILRPNGKLVLGTPDFDGAMARRFGDKYRLLHDPTHVSLFTNESLFRTLRDEGFIVEHVEYPFFETRHFTKESLMRLFDIAQMSPPFYGSFMTFFCEKPIHADIHARLTRLARAATISASTLDTQIARCATTVAEAVRRGDALDDAVARIAIGPDVDDRGVRVPIVDAAMERELRDAIACAVHEQAR